MNTILNNTKILMIKKKEHIILKKVNDNKLVHEPKTWEQITAKYPRVHLHLVKECVFGFYKEYLNIKIHQQGCIFLK